MSTESSDEGKLMTSYPAWTPAPQPGLIPLQPLTFGQVLGRTFSALRHNPKVLLGFAVVVQAIVSILGSVLITVALTSTFARLETVPYGTPEWNDLFAGSTALSMVVSVVVSLLLQCLTVFVQGVVAAGVGAGALGEKRSLGDLTRRVLPVTGRLIGYTLLLALALSLAVGLPLAGIIAIGFLGDAAIAIAVILGLLFLLAAVVGVAWISTKLALVPSIIVLERAGIMAAVRRSWSLTRGRFWPILGVIFLVSVIFSTVGSIIGGVVQMIGALVAATTMPLGEPESMEFFVTSLLAQLPGAVVQLVIASVSAVVLATAATILYIDARMRKEGLDVELLGYVERRDAGLPVTDDPYAYDAARLHRPAPVPGQYGQAGYPQAYAQPQHYGQPQYGQYAQPQQYGQPVQPQHGQPMQPQYGQPVQPVYGQPVAPVQPAPPAVPPVMPPPVPPFTPPSGEAR